MASPEERLLAAGIEVSFLTWRVVLAVALVRHSRFDIAACNQLPAASVPPAANYVPWVQTGNLVFISGQV